MGKSIRNRTIVIVVSLLICVFGIIGFPSTFQALKQNVADRIRLGLDLKGGTYLVLQVHVDDAVNTTSDQTLGRVRDVLSTRNIAFAEVHKTDATHILIKGVAQNRWAGVQAVVQEQFPEWYVQSVAGDPSSHLMLMKTTAEATIKNDAYTEAMATIRRRIDALGITEPEIAQYGSQGSYGLVVELPGVNDPTR
ncbi:MAG: protein translocase subunit SecD, partial [Terriglobia bacterium]